MSEDAVFKSATELQVEANPPPACAAQEGPTPMTDAAKVGASWIVASHSTRDFVPVELSEELEKERDRLKAERAAVASYLWPTEIGSLNEHRDVLLAIQTRDTLALNKIAALERLLAERTAECQRLLLASRTEGQGEGGER